VRFFWPGGRPLCNDVAGIFSLAMLLKRIGLFYFSTVFWFTRINPPGPAPRRYNKKKKEKNLFLMAPSVWLDVPDLLDQFPKIMPSPPPPSPFVIGAG